MIIKFKKLHEDAVIPEYQSKGASGFDFHAIEDVQFDPGETKIVRTGLAAELPSIGPVLYELQVRPRGSVSLKTPLRIANTPGTVDNDYRGEIGIIIQNTSKHRRCSVQKGDRIAQGVVAMVARCGIIVEDELSETERGDGAYGSTGK